MRPKFQLSYVGQEVQTADLNTIAQSASEADDRALAELLRLTPYDGTNVARGILPFWHQSSGGQQATVDVNGATGSVLVRAFRALIGARTTTDDRDMTSAVYAGGTVTFAAGDPTNPRWDLIEAVVTRDVGTYDPLHPTRKVKDPTTGVVTDQSVASQYMTTVTLNVVQGTAAASPAWPSATADADPVYRIPLAYVRIPAGFGSGSTVGVGDIAIVAPTPLRGTRPANVHTSASGAYLTASAIGTWGSTGTKPRAYLPADLAGGDSLMLAICFGTGEFADGTILDDSRDWRGRLTRFSVQTESGASSQFPWSATSGDSVAVSSSTNTVGYGQTCITTVTQPNMTAAFCTLSGSGAVIQIIADPTTGFLKLKVISGVPGATDIALFWIDFTSPIENYKR